MCVHHWILRTGSVAFTRPPYLPWAPPCANMLTQKCPNHPCKQTRRPSGQQAEDGTVHNQYLPAFRKEPEEIKISIYFGWSKKESIESIQISSSKLWLHGLWCLFWGPRTFYPWTIHVKHGDSPSISSWRDFWACLLVPLAFWIWDSHGTSYQRAEGLCVLSRDFPSLPFLLHTQSPHNFFFHLNSYLFNKKTKPDRLPLPPHPKIAIGENTPC